MAQTDFYLEIERAAGLTSEASCAVRAAGRGRLPLAHRQLVNTALAALTKAQQALFEARHDPWSTYEKKHRQLHLL